MENRRRFQAKSFFTQTIITFPHLFKRNEMAAVYSKNSCVICQVALDIACPPAREMLLSGVPQGSVLGPLIFIYINDIDADLFSKICKFADDTKVDRAVGTEDEVQLLKDDLKNLAKWAIDWRMLFNVENCVVMHTDTNNKLYSYSMNNASYKTVDVERDLGVVIKNN